MLFEGSVALIAPLGVFLCAYCLREYWRLMHPERKARVESSSPDLESELRRFIDQITLLQEHLKEGQQLDKKKKLSDQNREWFRRAEDQLQKLVDSARRSQELSRQFRSEEQLQANRK